MNTVNLFYQTFWCVVLLSIFMSCVVFWQACKAFAVKIQAMKHWVWKKEAEGPVCQRINSFCGSFNFGHLYQDLSKFIPVMQNKQYWQIQFLFIGSSHNFTFYMRKYNQPHSMFSWEAGLFHNTIKLPALFSLIPKLLQTQKPLRYFTFNMFA